MRISKFVVVNGRIEAREVIDSDSLDHALFRMAQNALTSLRETMSVVTDPLPNGPSFTVGLGYPFEAPIPVDRLTPDQIASIENNREETSRASKTTGFFLEHRGVYRFHKVVHSDAEEEDPGLFGFVAGTRAGVLARLPETERNQKTIAEQVAEFQAVEAEVRAARPSMVCTGAGSDPRSVFADCFAAAMLLNPV